MWLQGTGWMQMWVFIYNYLCFSKCYYIPRIESWFVSLSKNNLLTLLGPDIPKGSQIFFISPLCIQIACQQQHGGHLVFVLSGSEAAFVASLIKSSLKNNYYVWIGLHDPTEVPLHLFFYMSFTFAISSTILSISSTFSQKEFLGETRHSDI